jgi:hypothetical protein
METMGLVLALFNRLPQTGLIDPARDRNFARDPLDENGRVMMVSSRDPSDLYRRAGRY